MVSLMATEKALAQDLFKCELGVTLSATGTCGEDTGTITVEITGGFDQSYTIEYRNIFSGEVSGTVTTKNNSYTITGLPHSRYSVVVTDNRSRCEVLEQTIVLRNYFQGRVTVEGKPATCSGYGAIDIAIDGNDSPYRIDVAGPITARYISNSNNFSVYNLTSGDYEIVLKQGDCIQTFSTTIEAEPDVPLLTLDPVVDDCGISSGAVDFLISSGKAPYNIELSGPTEATYNVNRSFPTNGFEGGSYRAVLTDADGCVSIAVMDINTNPVSAAISTIGAGIRGNGFLRILPSGGTPGYRVSYSGPTNGARTARNSRELLIPVLAGSYDITVTDATGNDCSFTQTVTVAAGNSGSKIGEIPSNSLGSLDQVIVHQNYPNPFNGQTTIRFELPQTMETTITIQDHFGRVVKQQQQSFARGFNDFTVDGMDMDAGMYFYTISTTNFSTTRRMIVQ